MFTSFITAFFKILPHLHIFLPQSSMTLLKGIDHVLAIFVSPVETHGLRRPTVFFALAYIVISQN